MDLKVLKQKAHSLDPVVRIGKNGLTDTTIQEIIKVLKVRKLIKIKFLKSAIEDQDKKKFAQEIADKTKSKLVQVTGFVIVLYKR